VRICGISEQNRRLDPGWSVIGFKCRSPSDRNLVRVWGRHGHCAEAALHLPIGTAISERAPRPLFGDAGNCGRGG